MEVLERLRCQQAISSRVPKAVCRGTFTVWLMVSEWFGIVSQVLCGGRKRKGALVTHTANSTAKSCEAESQSLKVRVIG